MSEINNKLSVLIDQQLPDFVVGKTNTILRDAESNEIVVGESDYQGFVDFVNAYYEFLEQNNYLHDRTKSLLDYRDVDDTLVEFENFFFNEFLPYFPTYAVTSKRELIKFANELYQRKSTRASFKFLFRSIYNANCEVFETRDLVLIPSDGKWVVPKSVKINSDDTRFLEIANYRLFGTTSKVSARIERSQISEDKIEIFLSETGQKNFLPGETVKIVDSYFSDVFIAGDTLEATVSGFIPEIKVDQKYIGTKYSVGDPILIIGGINPVISIPDRAMAQVHEITSAGVVGLTVEYGSHGFRLPPMSSMDITTNMALTGSGAVGVISVVDANNMVTISDIPKDTINSVKSVIIGQDNYFSGSYKFSNTQINFANVNSRVMDALNYESFNVYPIKKANVVSKGSGYEVIPKVKAHSYYYTVTGNNRISYLGVLAPIKVTKGGLNYQINDTINFIGGNGSSYANVSNVAPNGMIRTVSYVYDPTGTNIFPLGGMGYNNSSLPLLTINSATGSGATLNVMSIMGDGERIVAKTDPIGGIKSVLVTDQGGDYSSTPNVSTRVADIIVSGNNLITLRQGTMVYQGSNAAKPDFYCYFYSLDKLANTAYNYNLRVYDYKGVFSNTKILYSDRVSSNDRFYQYRIETSAIYNGIYGYKFYGDGKAKANAVFSSGVIIGKGRYLNSDGHPSSFCKLQSDTYNYYTYITSVENSFSLYKSMMRNLLHPSGTKNIVRNVLGKFVERSREVSENLNTKRKLSYYLNAGNLTVSMNANTSNVLVLKNNSTTLSTVMSNTDYIYITTSNRVNVYSKIYSLDDANNMIRLEDKARLRYSNVAWGYANSNTIIITKMTDTYDRIFYDRYSSNNNTVDVFFVNDKLHLPNNKDINIVRVDYSKYIIYTTPGITLNYDGSNTSPVLMQLVKTLDTREIYLNKIIN